MALFPRYAINPLGQFDLVDTDMTNLKGGEVMTFTVKPQANSATETAAYDERDGYIYDVTVPVNNRAAATFATTNAQFPLFLSDDGVAGYGSLFGSVIGISAGLTTTGTDLGPNSAAASGKVTLWDKPGLYAISVTALATDFLTSVTTGAYAGLTPGTVLGFNNSSGRLAHAGCSGAVSGSGVGNFIEFEGPGSLVTTHTGQIGGTASYPNILFNFSAGNGIRTL